jgi:hypothetical protein
MYLAVGVGYLAGVMASFILGRRLLASFVRRAAGLEHRRSIVRMGAGAGLVALVPALLLGTVIGGTLGGPVGERLAPSGAGAAAGLAIGQFAITCLTIVAAVAIGGALGNVFGRGDRG